MAGKKGMKHQRRTRKRVALINHKVGSDVGYGWGLYVVPEEEGGGFAIDKIAQGRRPLYGPGIVLPPEDMIEFTESLLVTLSLRGALKPMTVRNV